MMLFRKVLALAFIKIKLVTLARSQLVASVLLDLSLAGIPMLLWMNTNQSEKLNLAPYYFFYFLFSTVSIWTHGIEFGQQVENGQIKSYLYRPVSILRVMVGSWLGTLISRLSVIIPALIILLFLIYPLPDIYFGVFPLLLICLGLVFSCIFGMCIGVLALYFESNHFLLHLAKALTFVFGGGLIPYLKLFEYKVSLFNPFGLLGGLQAAVLSNSLSYEVKFAILFSAICWNLVLAFGYYVLYSNAKNRIAIVGD
ncbi:MAG: hypothetical protein IPL83_10785 [Bdellovibrionales bacterium]|nr:hypothetical protein [Bdellovibrionales bacterium]